MDILLRTLLLLIVVIIDANCFQVNKKYDFTFDESQGRLWFCYLYQRKISKNKFFCVKFILDNFTSKVSI